MTHYLPSLPLFSHPFKQCYYIDYSLFNTSCECWIFENLFSHFCPNNVNSHFLIVNIKSCLPITYLLLFLKFASCSHMSSVFPAFGGRTTPQPLQVALFEENTQHPLPYRILHSSSTFSFAFNFYVSSRFA